MDKNMLKDWFYRPFSKYIMTVVLSAGQSKYVGFFDQFRERIFTKVMSHLPHLGN
jgi:hypothetical protein